MRHLFTLVLFIFMSQTAQASGAGYQCWVSDPHKNGSQCKVVGVLCGSPTGIPGTSCPRNLLQAQCTDGYVINDNNATVYDIVGGTQVIAQELNPNPQLDKHATLKIHGLGLGTFGATFTINPMTSVQRSFQGSCQVGP